MSLRFGTGLLAGVSLLSPAAISAEAVSVVHREGLVHGFLALSTLEGEILADGDLIQSARGDRVTSRLVLRFRDGSVHDETVVFSQRRNFRLLSDHLIQKGPAFQHPMEVSIDGRSGQITVHCKDEDGHEKVAAEHIDLPTDVGNGLILTLMKNIRPDAAQTTVSMVAATPKPRLVKLVIRPAGEEPFSIGGSPRKAMHYVVKVEIGGAGRADRAARGRKASGLPCLDPRRGGSGFREVGGSTLSRRTLLADRAVESRLAPGRDPEALKRLTRLLRGVSDRAELTNWRSGRSPQTPA